MQPKFDGHRCLAIRDAQGVKLFSRQATEIDTCGHIVDALETIMEPGMTLDGELYTHGVAVTTIGGYIKRKQAGTDALCFVVYDLVDQEASYANRLNRLQPLFWHPQHAEPIYLAPTAPVSSFEMALDFQQQFVEQGYEGAILRHGLAGYLPGSRSGNLLKLKTFIDGEVTIVGCKQGRGKYEGAAVFECMTDDNNPVDVTAPGDMPTKRQFWTDRERYVGKRLTIKYQKLTETANPVPFQPVAKGIRE